MSKVYLLTCFECYKQWEDTVIVNRFCSQECQNHYWANAKDKKVNITTVCPTCQKEWSRLVYTIECCGYQAIVMCPGCFTESITLVGNNKVWSKS